MASRIKIDRKAFREDVLIAKMRGPIDAAVAAIAAAVDVGTHEGAPVVTRSFTTDRSAGAVSVARRDGLAMEAKYGTLAKAAASVGLTVKSKK